MEIEDMVVETTQHNQPLSLEQLDIIERARTTPYVVSRSRRRQSGAREWTHTPAVRLARDIDLVDLVKRERHRELSDAFPIPETNE